MHTHMRYIYTHVHTDIYIYIYIYMYVFENVFIHTYQGLAPASVLTSPASGPDTKTIAT